MQVFNYFFLVSKADNEIRVTLSFLIRCLENLLPLYGKKWGESCMDFYAEE